MGDRGRKNRRISRRGRGGGGIRVERQRRRRREEVATAPALAAAGAEADADNLGVDVDVDVDNAQTGRTVMMGGWMTISYKPRGQRTLLVVEAYSFGGSILYRRRRQRQKLKGELAQIVRKCNE